MKKTNSLFIGMLAVIAILFAACKKDAKEQPTTAQRVQQKWNFEKTYYHEAIQGLPDYRDTTIGAPGEYADFRADNKIYSFTDGYFDTIPYSILSDTKMIIDGDTATIQVLTDTQFQLTAQGGDYPTDYWDYSLYFKK